MKRHLALASRHLRSAWRAILSAYPKNDPLDSILTSDMTPEQYSAWLKRCRRRFRDFARAGGGRVKLTKRRIGYLADFHDLKAMLGEEAYTYLFEKLRKRFPSGDKVSRKRSAE
ncbi:MAG: hypothetical protein RB191_24530 [Terriglobia bacterium]|nr:hypothetical protein [Terriglobia bacterium]